MGSRILQKLHIPYPAEVLRLHFPLWHLAGPGGVILWKTLRRRCLSARQKETCCSLRSKKPQQTRAMLTPGWQSRTFKAGTKAWLIRKTPLKLNSGSKQQRKAVVSNLILTAEPRAGVALMEQSKAPFLWSSFLASMEWECWRFLTVLSGSAFAWLQKALWWAKSQCWQYCNGWQAPVAAPALHAPRGRILSWLLSKKFSVQWDR